MFLRTLAAVAVALLIGASVVAFNLGAETSDKPLGSASGDTFTYKVNFLDGIFAKKFSTGGDACTLTDANGGTYTLTQAELERCSYLSFAAGGGGQAVVALTLPATSTMTSLLTEAGSCRSWVYDASALAAATTTTVTAGTGHDVVAYTTADDVIDGNEFAQITMCRQPDRDVTTFTTEILQAD